MIQNSFKNSENKKYQLKIIREFNISSNILFDMLTQQNHIMEWFGTPELKIEYCEGELKIGKNYNIGMKSNITGEILIYSGVYKEIHRPDKLVYSMFAILPNGKKTGETVITISLDEIGNKTRMVFIQSGFNTEENRDKSQISWEYEFDTLNENIDMN